MIVCYITFLIVNMYWFAFLPVILVICWATTNKYRFCNSVSAYFPDNYFKFPCGGTALGVSWKSEHNNFYTSTADWWTIFHSYQCTVLPFAGSFFNFNLKHDMHIFLCSKIALMGVSMGLVFLFQDAIPKPETGEKVPSVWIEHTARNGKK